MISTNEVTRAGHRNFRKEQVSHPLASSHLKGNGLIGAWSERVSHAICGSPEFTLIMREMIGLPVVIFAAECFFAQSDTLPGLESSPDRVWHGEIGDGFAKGARSLEVKVSRAFGTTAMGSNAAHDLWLAQVQAGLMLADVMEPKYWFGGNLEGLAQITAGGQDRPHAAYFTSLNAGLRYHFRTGTAVVPFLTGSFGIGITDIDDPDATGKFQFNEQGGVGLRYFLNREQAITVEYGLWHISNGGMREPNDGVNAHVFTVGFGWLF
jgi:hypothetical protein